MSTLSSRQPEPSVLARLRVRQARDRWIAQMAVQGNWCAECGSVITIENSAKRGYTNEIICQTCYAKPLTGGQG